jgi:hypothetical protein
VWTAFIVATGRGLLHACSVETPCSQGWQRL